MAVLANTFAALYGEVGRVLFNSDAMNVPQTTEAKRIVNDAYAEFLGAHDWSFLSPEAAITFWTTTTTGVVTITGSGLIFTSASADFYASMVGKQIVAVTSGNSWTIDSYTSSTVIGVSADASADTGDTFTITANGVYPLPTGFAYLIDGFTFDDQVSQRVLLESTPEQMRQMQAGEQLPAGDPEYYAIVPREYVTTSGQQFDVQVWPTPGTTRAMRYRYRVSPASMTADAEYPVGGPVHSATMLDAVRKQVEVTKGLVNGPATTRYEQLSLPRSIRADNDARPRNLGPILDNSDAPTVGRVRPVIRQGVWTHT